MITDGAGGKTLNSPLDILPLHQYTIRNKRLFPTTMHRRSTRQAVARETGSPSASPVQRVVGKVAGKVGEIKVIFDYPVWSGCARYCVREIGRVACSR